MENRGTRLFKLGIAIIAVLVLGIICGVLTTVGAQELTEALTVDLNNYETYTFTPSGYSVGDRKVEHTGTYILIGEANQDLCFTSDNGAPVTYDVIFHGLYATADVWYGICSVEQGVTLNLTVYGECRLMGYNHPGISVGAEYEGASAPVVNVTVAENSRITLGSQYYSTDLCVSPDIQFNLNEEATSSLDMTKDGWQNNSEVVFSRGDVVKHKRTYNYIDDEICQIACDTCDVVEYETAHEWEGFPYEKEHPNYASAHQVKCENCKHATEEAEHEIEYDYDEEKHRAYCTDCYYEADYEEHIFEGETCTVCKKSRIASLEVDGKTTKFISFHKLLEEASVSGGKITLLSDITLPGGVTVGGDDYSFVIDLAGYTLDGVRVAVKEGFEVKIIDSSSDKTGKWLPRRYENVVKGTLTVEGATVGDISLGVYGGGYATVKDATFENAAKFQAIENGAIELTNVDFRDKLTVTLDLESARVTVNSGKIASLTVISIDYGVNSAASALLADGYAFANENGVLDGSRPELAGVTSIVPHTEHLIDSYSYNTEAHWVACACGYTTVTENEPHSIDENALCPTCKAEIAASVYDGTALMYFTSIEKAFEAANMRLEAEVELQRDITFEKTLTIENTIVLNLNGHTLLLTDERMYVYGKLTVVDKSEEQTGKLHADKKSHYVIQIQGNGTLNLVSGEIKGKIYAASVGVTIETTNAKFISEGLFWLAIDTVLTINGGFFECTEYVVRFEWQNADNVTINGGVFKNSTLFAVYMDDSADLLEKVMGKEESCNLVFVTEDGQVMGINELSAYYEGIIVVAHEQAELKSSEDGHFFECTQCDVGKTDILKHTEIYEPSTQDTQKHTVKCLYCEYVMGQEEHSGGSATCTERAECEFCLVRYGNEPKGHQYDGACDAECNNCTVGQREAEDHKYDNDCDAECNVCGASRETEDHKYDNACDAECNVCGASRETEDHKYDNACDAECNVCGASRETEDHKYDNACDAECNECGAKRETTHKYGPDGKCSVCGARDPDYKPGTGSTSGSNTGNGGDGGTSQGGTSQGGSANQNGGSNDPEDDGGMSAGAIVAIVVGSVAAAGGTGVTVYLLAFKKRKK